MKKVVYTILLGNNNLKLNEPEFKNDDWSLICFTDRDIKSEHWNLVKVKHKDPLKKSREIKIKCDQFIDFDICIYTDSQFTIKCDLDNFVNTNLNHNFAVMKHTQRKCAYKEALHCINKNKGDKNTIRKQIESYREDGFPKKFGLYACGILIRKNESTIMDFMKLWYEEIKKYTYRDQISFPYVLWKNPIKMDVMDFRKTCNLFR